MAPETTNVLSVAEKICIINKNADEMPREKLHLIIEMTIEELCDILHCSYDSNLDNIIVRMLNEKFNRGIENDGIDSVNYSGISENYSEYYSAGLVAQINSKRKFRMI